METEFGVVTGKHKVLPIVVHDQRILMSIIKCIEQAVRVLFGLVEKDDIVLVLVAQSISKDSDSAVDVGEDKAAKVTGERLRTSTHRNEIVVGTHVRNLRFVEPFLKRPICRVTIRAFANVRRDDPQLLNLEIVLIEDHVHPQPPINRLKCSISFEKVERGGVVLREKELVRVSKKLIFGWILRRFKGRGWNGRLAILEKV